MSRCAVVIPFPPRPKSGFSLSAICEEAEQVERRSSRLLAVYVATSLALLAALQLLAMH